MTDQRENEPAPIADQAFENFEVPTSPPIEVSLPGAEPLRPTELIRLPARHNPTLQNIVARANADEDLHAIWRCQNVNGVDRLGMNDHGPVHMQIVANIGLKLLRLLELAGVEPSAVRDHKLTRDDAEVIVVLAALLHDAGMSIHRDEHEQMSLFVALPKLKELLEGIYPPARRRVIISETLHAIISHRSGGHPLTIEAGVVRLADALDMAQGRSRIPFEQGYINIHSVSAISIEAVEISAGEQKPIRIAIHMSNAAGLYQIDELLREKLKGSGLEEYVEVAANVEGEADKRLFETFNF